jgi:hypothetical protein
MICEVSMRGRIVVLTVLAVAAGWIAWELHTAADDGPPKEDSRTKEDSRAAVGVRRFGAVGDGRADDTLALQRAVDSSEGEVYLPRGVYRITRPIEVDLDRVGTLSIRGDASARILMAGAGPALRFTGTHFASADPGGFADAVWQRQRMPTVDGLAIEGGHAEAVGIEAVGTMQLTITRVHIRKALHGIHLVRNNRNVIISDCQLYENRGVGIYYDDVNLHQSNIANCHISYNAGGGIVSRKGNVRNIHITGCDLESNMHPDAPPTANVLIDCRESQYGTAEVAITGCTIQHNNPSPDSANIRILGNSNPSRNLARVREGNVTISGNVLSDVQVNVHLSGCRGVAITGNTFWQGYQYNLLVEDCAHIVVGPNNFDRNPRYDYGNTADARNGLLFRDCDDCTLQGLHISNVWRHEAGLVLENCGRFNVTGCTILDCDTAGLLLRNVGHSRVSDCLIRDDRPEQTTRSFVVEGGGSNMIVDNALHAPLQGESKTGRVEDNLVVPPRGSE